jgi:Major Facilitator Superfamily
MSQGSGEPDVRRWLALALLGTAFFMVILDGTIVYVALPSIDEALGFSSRGLQWVMSAYLLTFGGLLLLGGRSSDLLGRRRMFMVGVSLFAGSSLLCGLAWSDRPNRCVSPDRGALGGTAGPAAYLPLATFGRRQPRPAHAGAALDGTLIIVTLYAQEVLGYSTVQFGLGVAALTVMSVVGAVSGQALVTRIGLKPVALTGMTLVGTACLVLTRVSVDGATSATSSSACCCSARGSGPPLLPPKSPRCQASPRRSPASPRASSTPRSTSAARLGSRCSRPSPSLARKTCSRAAAHRPIRALP